MHAVEGDVVEIDERLVLPNTRRTEILRMAHDYPGQELEEMYCHGAGLVKSAKEFKKKEKRG